MITCILTYNYAAITCSPLMSPTNGAVSYGGAVSDVHGNFEFNVTATYFCDTGFALINSDSLTRTCTGDGMSVNGSFSGTAPTCDRECRLTKPSPLSNCTLIHSYNLPCCGSAE